MAVTASSEMRARARAWLAEYRREVDGERRQAIADYPPLTSPMRERAMAYLRAELEIIDYLAGLVDGGPHGE